MSTCDTHHVAPLSGPQGLGQQVPVGCRPPFQIWLKDGNKLTIGNLARCNGVIKMGATHPEIYHGSGISRYTSRSWSCCSNLNLKRPQMGWSVSLLPWTCCFHRPTQGWYRNSPRHHKLWVCNPQRHRRNPNWMHHPDSQPSPDSVWDTKWHETTLASLADSRSFYLICNISTCLRVHPHLAFDLDKFYIPNYPKKIDLHTPSPPGIRCWWLPRRASRSSRPSPRLRTSSGGRRPWTSSQCCAAGCGAGAGRHLERPRAGRPDTTGTSRKKSQKVMEMS